MKKLLSVFLLTAFVLLGGGGAAAAQEIFFGQQQAYTVVFRGNGEAVVSARFVISNPDETPMTEFSFQIPKAQVSELSMYQIKLSEQCIRYGATVGQGQICLEWREPDYQNRYGFSSGGKTEYQKITYSVSGDTYRFTFPSPIEKFGTTAIVLSYAAKGYVKERAGLYAFQFETIKVPQRITEINVTADVDSDLYLKGKRSSVNYGNSASGLRTTEAAGIGQNAALDAQVSRIGSYGPIMKTGKNLSPNEAFIVKGSYAKSWGRLHLSAILISILIVVGLIVGIPLLTGWIKRRMGSKKKGEAMSSASSFNPFSLQYLLVSFVSVVLIAGLSFFLQWFTSSDFERFVFSDPFVQILFIVTVILMYVLLIFGPAAFVGIKKGWKAVLSIIVGEFCWLIIALIVAALFFQNTSGMRMY